MDERKTATPKQMLAIGLLFAAVGLYFALVGLGLLPVPGGNKALHAPLWIVFLAGLAFFLGGLAAILQGVGGANANGELPADAPRWMRAAQGLIVLAIFVAFALMASWIAFAPGERHITATIPFYSGPANEWIGRGAFGLGAVIMWLATIALAVSGARKLIGRDKV
jgi:hypothetical protein